MWIYLLYDNIFILFTLNLFLSKYNIYYSWINTNRYSSQNVNQKFPGDKHDVSNDAMHTNEQFNYWKYTYKSNHSSIIAIKSQYYHIARLNQVHIITLQFHNIYILIIKLNILIFIIFYFIFIILYFIYILF